MLKLSTHPMWGRIGGGEMAKAKGRGRSRQSKTRGKRQRRIARSKLKEQQRRRKRTALIAGLILAVGLSAYLLLSLRGPGEAVGLADSPRIVVTPRSYDFGIVSQAGGVVTTELTLGNRGGKELVITGMRTSCGCTQASLIIDGEEGPLFGMHNNPTGWRARLAPGERAKLKVYYDPNVHGGLRGPVTREIEIYSNDPRHPVYTVRIELVQTE